MQVSDEGYVFYKLCRIQVPARGQEKSPCLIGFMGSKLMDVGLKKLPFYIFYKLMHMVPESIIFHRFDGFQISA